MYVPDEYIELLKGQIDNHKAINANNERLITIYKKMNRVQRKLISILKEENTELRMQIATLEKRPN